MRYLRKGDLYMNIARFLLPKSSVAYIFDHDTLRQGIEKIRHYGYTAIPVITEESKYVGTISEGDFLWYLVEDAMVQAKGIDKESLEKTLIREVVMEEKNPPVCINTSIEELLVRAMNQNFVPVIDDRGIFIGIVTRKDIIKYFYEASLGKMEV